MTVNMTLTRALALAAAALLGGCAHHSLSGGDLEQVRKPAFVSRIEENAGPQSVTFREDPHYHGKLKKLDPKEADRRLVVKLGKAISRFELSDRLRASLQARLPKERPWTQTVDPARVASVLESYLVEEVPANAPDYDLLRPLGVDAVVELNIEAYGMGSEKGGAYAFLKGHARMFRLDGGELWRYPFEVDGRKEGRAPLDPFLVAKEPERFHDELIALIDGLATHLSEELTPPNRKVPAALVPEKAGDDLSAPPDDTNRTGKENQKKDELPPGELPPPDPPRG